MKPNGSREQTQSNGNGRHEFCTKIFLHLPDLNQPRFFSHSFHLLYFGLLLNFKGQQVMIQRHNSGKILERYTLN